MVTSKHEQRWRPFIRENPDHTAHGASFSLGLPVQLIYGRANSAALTDERGLIGYALAFANSAEDRSGAVEYVANVEQVRNLPPSVGSLSDEAKQLTAATLAQLEPERIENRRERLRRFLTAVVGDRAAAASRFSQNADRLLAHIDVHARAVRGPDGGVQLVYHRIINDADAFEAFVSTLLLDRDDRGGKGDLGDELCMCQYDECGGGGGAGRARFWLVQRRGKHEGRPEDRYCPGSNHRKLAHEKASARRKRDQRTRQRAIELLGRKGFGTKRALELVQEAFKARPDADAEQLAELARAASPARRKRK